MNTKLIEKIKRSAIKGRLGDFICNFIAVVLGIAITFVGSDMIQEHNKKKEVAQALQLVKSELLINRETIEEMMKIEKINRTKNKIKSTARTMQMASMLPASI